MNVGSLTQLEGGVPQIDVDLVNLLLNDVVLIQQLKQFNLFVLFSVLRLLQLAHHGHMTLL
jgi:hypothetical protein